MANKTTEDIEIPAPVEQTQETGFRYLSLKEKRFHILFYALAGLTGLVVVQFIWQIAVLTK